MYLSQLFRDKNFTPKKAHFRKKPVSKMFSSLVLFDIVGCVSAAIPLQLNAAGRDYKLELVQAVSLKHIMEYLFCDSGNLIR